MIKEFEKRILSSVILIPIAIFFIIKGSVFFSFFLSISFLATSYEWIKMSKKNNLLKLLGIVFLLFSFYTAFEIREYKNFEYFLFICIFTDIGGYTFGKFFKGPKLTKISPKKTYSGVVGGYLFSIIFITLFFNNLDFISELTKIEVTPQELSFENFILTIYVSTASQLGDIIVSFFKRKSNIKDTGKIIPGHGGLLDRIDGMIFALPFSYLIIYIYFNMIL